MLLPALCTPAFAAEIFDYDKFINNPNYEVRAETRNNAKMYYWSGEDADKLTDTGERLLLYYLFNARDAKEKPGYRLFEQTVHLKYKLPSAYTSLYTPNRTYRYYIADFLGGSNKVKDNTLDQNVDSYEYQYSYKDFNKDGKSGVQPGETEAYIAGSVGVKAPTINLYHLKYGSNTPTMEEAAEKQYEEFKKEKEANTDDRKTITVEQQGGGDNILLVYHSFWDDSAENTSKTYKYHEGGSTLIEEVKYEEIIESYEYYYYTRIPGISDVYTVNHLNISRVTIYWIGLISPKKEVVDLYNDMMAKWQASVAMAPSLYGMMPEVIADEPITYEGFNIAGVTKRAETNPGEDGGVSVPAAIVIGVLGGGAAIAGAAAAAGGSDDKKRKQKSYKMYVQKDFGDAIRRGGDKPVKIRARMAEVDENGAEHDRNDLTSNIGVSADGMTVHSSALVGRYCEATVSVPEKNQSDTANITFTFMGEGGSFTNTVVFRLVDGPSLKFVDERDGTLYHENCGIDAIPGDGFTYTERFAIVDAPTPPKLSDITAVNTGEFDVEFALTDQPALYKMTVKNNTAPDPEHDVFAKPQDKNFEIHVIVEGEKEPVKGYVTVKLYPEGITVSSTMEGKKNDVKYVRVQAYEKEYVGDLDRKWQVSEIKFTLAVKGEDRAIVDPKETEYKFDKLKGAGGKGTRADKEQSLAEKYEYKESWGDWNGKFTYTFEPNTTLVEPDDGSFFMVLLPALCEYDGETYKAEIPLRLRGKPLDPMAAWEKEYKDLTERVEKFALPENKEYWVKKITELAYDDPKCSVEELRLTSKYLIRQYMRYWTIESMKYRDEAAVYDVIVDYLEWAKFFGDCAFSILVNMYAGPVAEAIISPTKDFLAGAIGETMAAWVRGQSVDVDKFEFSKNVAAAGDNLVSGQISLTSWKQAAATLGCYFAYASIKNFILTLREENKFDLYGAIIKGFSDMTSAGLKAAAGHLFDSWLKSCPKFRAKISAWCGSFVTRHLGASASLLDLRAVDGLTRAEILRKYLDGLFGMAIDKLIEKDGEIHDKFISSETGFEFDANGHLIVQIFFEVAEHHYDCTVDVTKALANAAGTVAGFGTGGVGSDSFSDFFLFIYEELFGAIPSAAAVIAAPADPPLPPSKD